jgi:hypothetical protein
MLSDPDQKARQQADIEMHQGAHDRYLIEYLRCREREE